MPGDLSSIQPNEWIILGPLILVLVFPMVSLYFTRPQVKFWQPTTIVCLTFLYYCVLGPYFSMKLGETVVVYKDARPFYHLGWTATLIGMVGYFAGYQAGLVGSSSIPLGQAKRGRRQKLKSSSLVFLFLGSIGLLFTMRATGMSLGTVLNPAGSSSQGMGQGLGTFGNYIMHMGALFGGYILILVATYRGLKMRILLPALGLLFFLLMYLAAIGFRGNLIEVLLGFGAVIYILKGKRPSAPVILVSGLAILYFAGLILFTRSYFGGLQLERIEGKSTQQILEGGFNDSAIFGAMSLCINVVPERFPYHGMENIWLTATMPIPRRIWSGKPDSEYLDAIQRILGEGEEYDTVGQAIPNIGEYYMAFGWWGIFVGMFIFGIICRKFWRWYVANRNGTLATVAYCTFFAWIFSFLHRGYLPQTFTDFCFSVIPILLLRKYVGEIPIRTITSGRTASEHPKPEEPEAVTVSS